MANVGDTIILKASGISAVVTHKFYSTVPSSSARPQGCWEASNYTQINQWYLNPSISLDSARNSGMESPGYAPAVNPAFSPANPDWSGGRVFNGSGSYDSIPYTEYSVYSGTKGAMQSVVNGDLGGANQRSAAILPDGTVIDSVKLNHPFIP